MPKMPSPFPPRRGGPKPVVAAPLGGLRPMHGDRNNGRIRIVTLRPPEVTREIAALLADPDVMEGWNAPRKEMGLDAFRAYAASFDGIRRNLLVIRDMADDRPLGLVVLNIDHRHRTGAWHMCIGRSEDRGQKIGQWAGLLAVRHAFEDHKLEKLSFELLERNRIAIEVVEKYGLPLEGVLRKHRIDAVTGERLDQRVYGLTLEQYRMALDARRKAGLVQPFEGPGLRPA